MELLSTPEMLTGLVECGGWSGRDTMISKGRLRRIGARNMGICDNRPSIQRDVLKKSVLQGHFRALQCFSERGSGRRRPRPTVLVDRIELTREGNDRQIALQDSLAAILRFAENKKNPGALSEARFFLDALLSQESRLRGARNTRFLRLVERSIPRLAA